MSPNHLRTPLIVSTLQETPFMLDSVSWVSAMVSCCLSYWRMYSFVVLNCLKFAWRCKRYLKLPRIRTKMEVRLKWEELSGRKLAETVQPGYAALSRASRRLPMSRGHKLTLGTNARESRLARRRRRRRTALSCDASGGLKNAGLHLYWLGCIARVFPKQESCVWSQPCFWRGFFCEMWRRVIW